MILDARIPLGFDNEDAICRRQIQTVVLVSDISSYERAHRVIVENQHSPVSTGTGCHDEDRHIAIPFKVVQDPLPSKERALAINAFKGYGMPAEMLCN